VLRKNRSLYSIRRAERLFSERSLYSLQRERLSKREEQKKIGACRGSPGRERRERREKTVETQRKRRVCTVFERKRCSSEKRDCTGS
jgi:hypothetical protein